MTTTSTPRQMATTTFKRLRNGDWGIQGHGLRAGQQVTVTKRSGETSTVTVGRILFSGDDGYAIATIENAQRATATRTRIVSTRHRSYVCDECGDRVRPGTQCWETGLTH